FFWDEIGQDVYYASSSSQLPHDNGIHFTLASIPYDNVIFVV
ncbi:5064_t:CDS:1, partial [Gigaspora rosea]